MKCARKFASFCDKTGKPLRPDSRCARLAPSLQANLISEIDFAVQFRHFATSSRRYGETINS